MDETSSIPVLMSATIVARLRAAGCVFAEDEARLLAGAAGTEAELAQLVERRVAGVPLEQILGWAEFCGLRIVMEPGVFVPRRRTEFLAGRAAALARAGAVVVDLCCGSGAVGAVLAATLDRVELHAVDIDESAVRCARRNLPHASVHRGDLYEPLPDRLRGRVDVLVANAPYVPTGEIPLMPPEARLHEPRIALDGGGGGLDVLRRITVGAPDWLAPGGHLLVETSTRQAPEILATAATAGLSAGLSTSDELGAAIVIGTRPRPAAYPDPGA